MDLARETVAGWWARERDAAWCPDGRVRFFADTGTGGYMDGAVFLIRPYSAKITNLQWSQLKSYWRGQFADIA